MTVKECSHHHGKWRKRFRRLFACLLIFCFIVLVVVLLIWAILQPKSPKFILQDATVYTFNLTAPNFLTSTIQVTLLSRNPNDNIGIYYDKLDVYATYHDQQITYYTGIPPVYQGHKGVNVWSPFIVGTDIPVAPYNGVSLSQDQAQGTVILLVKVVGRVRWKVGSFISGTYHLNVNCPAMITFGSQSSGIVVGDNAVKYQLVQSCSVSV